MFTRFTIPLARILRSMARSLERYNQRHTIDYLIRVDEDFVADLEFDAEDLFQASMKG